MTGLENEKYQMQQDRIIFVKETGPKRREPDGRIIYKKASKRRGQMERLLIKSPRKIGGLISRKPGLNRRPTHYECVALPTEPFRRVELSTLVLYMDCMCFASIFFSAWHGLLSGQILQISASAGKKIHSVFIFMLSSTFRKYKGDSCRFYRFSG